MANPFAGLKTAKVSGSGSYLSKDFDGVLQIDKVEYNERLNDGGAALIVEMTVLESNNSTDANGKLTDPVGAKRSWFQKENTSFPGAVLEWLYACLKCDFKQDEAKAETIRNNAETLMEGALKGKFDGYKIRCRTTYKQTKVKKMDFTRHVWGPYIAA